MDAKKSEGEPISMEEARRLRWVKFFDTLLNPLFGSIWWIDESIWLHTLRAQGYGTKSTRKNHPGLSLRESERIRELSAAIPMLYGTSNRSVRAFQVHGLTCTQPAATYFGHFRSVSLPLLTFKDRDLIRINMDKPRLDAAEQQALREYIDQTGMMQ
jgi:hypothetical protein